MIRPRSLILLLGIAHLPKASAALFFSGGNDNWYDPANWSDQATGAPVNRVPLPSDDVFINAATSVVIDPAAGGNIMIGNLTVSDQALLTLQPGSVLNLNTLTIDDAGFMARSSLIGGLDFRVHAGLGPGGWGCAHCGVVLGNPTQFVFDEFNWDDGRFQVFIGGPTPAGPGELGAGHHTSFLTGDYNLDGVVNFADLYGFVPTLGESFTIIDSSGTRTGTFANAPEGSIVKTYGSVGLAISYQGGDGNDVVLTAVSVPEPTSLSFSLLALLPLVRRKR